MAVESSEMKTRKPVERPLPTGDAKLKIKPVNVTDEGDLPIFIHEKVLKEIITYSRSDKSQELGGVLVGCYFISKDRPWIEIDAYLSARLGEGHSASFKFTHEAWHDIHQRLGDIETRVIVGWHHTHPTFGCFLSSHDRFIQDYYFNLPWQVALVVDPCRNTLSFFQWRGSDVKDCGFFLIMK